MKYYAVIYRKTYVLVIVVLTIQTVFNINNARDYSHGILCYSGKYILAKSNLLPNVNDSVIQAGYNRIINEALDFQLKADSLGRLAKKKRASLHLRKSGIQS